MLPSFLPSLPPFLFCRKEAEVAARNNRHPLPGGGSHQGVPPQEVLVVAWGPAVELAAAGALPTERWAFSAMGCGVVQGEDVQTAPLPHNNWDSTETATGASGQHLVSRRDQYQMEQVRGR